MGEGTCYTAEPAPSPEPRKCQDQEDLIPLLLLSLIFFIVGINVVTMLWRHLKRFLRALFNRIFPKDKQASCVDSHRMRRRRCVDPKKPRSRVSSRLRHRPNFLLGQPNHPDSWIRDKKDEKASKYCRMPPQCGRAGASTQVPRRLWKERVVRAAEAPAVTALKSQANFYSRSEKRNTNPQTPVYPTFLYSKDAVPSQPYFHSQNSAQRSPCTMPPPCTLYLPLVSPRSWVLHQHSNHQKPSTLMQPPTLPPTSKSSQSVLSSQGPIPPQLSTTSQTPSQAQPPELHESLDLNQGSVLPRTPGLSKVCRVSRNPGLTTNPGTHKSPGLIQDPGLPKNTGLAQDPGLHKLPGPHKGPALTQYSGLSQRSGLHNNSCLIPNPGLHKDAGQHIPRPSVPPRQNCRSPRAQVAYNDLLTFSEVPVLIVLQSPSQQAGSQGWVYHPKDTVPPACQNHRQMSTPPKTSWKPYHPSGTRLGHVVFDARQRQFRAGRDK
ncbi:uncharacterized protein [Tursiops truncatus]|uniref:uncharacterized protein isoform X1 n=1 Tax=Tursiops truncatus TaxID=9739 RepID=UPI003CCF3228